MCEKIERRGAGHLVVIAARHVAHPPHFAHAGAVHAERVEPPPRELEAAKEDAHLLGVVHAVEHDDGRRRAGGLGLHQKRGQRGALVRHLDELDVRVAQANALVPDLVGVGALRLFLGAGRDEPLGVVVVDAGAEKIVAGGDLAVSGERLLAAPLDLIAECAPFLEPGFAAVRLALAGAEFLAGAIHFFQRDDAVGRHAFEDEGGVRPEKIIAEVIDPGAARRHYHSLWLRRMRSTGQTERP
jgi:hypothetical protein